jgi:hypothetical protein
MKEGTNSSPFQNLKGLQNIQIGKAASLLEKNHLLIEKDIGISEMKTNSVHL